MASIIYLGKNDNEVGLVIGLSCVNGTKKMFFMLSSFPIFSALVLRPSFVVIPSNTGLFSLKKVLIEFKTELSYIDVASLAI